MAIGGSVAMILDNLLPGTAKERGIHAWRKVVVPPSGGDSGKATIHVYDPICTKLWVGRKWLKYVPFLPYYSSLNQSYTAPVSGDEESSGVEFKT